MNTKLFGLFIALLVCLPSLAQQKPVEKVDSDGVYLMPDQMPEFPGGMQAMMKFLTTNIKYPVEAQKKGVSGRVIVQFVIMEDGTLDQAKVVRGVDPLLDEEALRVVKLMPKWKPGMDRGEAVKVRFTAPIMFNLSRSEAQRPTFPELVVPIGQEVENRSLQGVWQSCVVQPGEHGYKILLLPVFIQGVKNEISVERLHDNLIKLSFTVPGQGRKVTEYWFRAPSPDVKIMAD